MLTELIAGTSNKKDVIQAYRNFFGMLSNNADTVKDSLARSVVGETVTDAHNTLVYDDNNIGHVVSVQSLCDKIAAAQEAGDDVISVIDAGDNLTYDVHIDKVLAEYGDSCQLAAVYSDVYEMLGQVADGADYSTADVMSIMNVKYGDLTDQSRAFIANIGPVFENYDNLSINTVNQMLQNIINLQGSTEEDAVDTFVLGNMDANVSGKCPIAAWFSAISVKWNINWNTFGGVMRGIGYILFKFPFDAQKQLRKWAGQLIGKVGKTIGVNTVAAPSVMDNGEKRFKKQVGDYRFTLEFAEPNGVRKRFTHIASLAAKCRNKGQALAVPIGPSTLYIWSDTRAGYNKDYVSICWGPMDSDFYTNSFINTGGLFHEVADLALLNDSYGFTNVESDSKALYDLCIGQMHTIQLMQSYMLASGSSESAIINAYTKVADGQVPRVYCPYWDSLNIISRPASNLGLVSQIIDPHGTFGNTADALMNQADPGIRFIDIASENQQAGEDVITDLVANFVDTLAMYVQSDDQGTAPESNGQFIPYRWVSNVDDCRYSVATDAQNAARFGNLMKNTLIIAAVVVAAIVGTKLALKFVKYKRNLMAEYNGADWHVTDVYSNPNSTPEEKAEALAAFNKLKKKAKRLGLLKSAAGSSFNALSSGLYSTAVDGLDSLSKIDKLEYLISGKISS